MVRRSKLDIHRTKITAMTAIALAQNQSSANAISEEFSSFVKMATWADIYEEDREISLMEEYQKMSHLRPVISRDADGNLSVKGI